MRTLSSALTETLSQPATTVCQAWVIRRKDGVVIGLTEHDRALTIASVICTPMDGADATATEARLGLNSETANLTGFLSSDVITDADIAAGRYGDAEVEQYIVDWKSPSSASLLRRYRMGEVRREDDVYVAEVRGTAGLADRPDGRVYARSCAAAFCDRNCGLDRATYSEAITITAYQSSTRLRLSAVPTRDLSDYIHGTLECVIDGETQRLVVSAIVQPVAGEYELTLVDPCPGISVPMTASLLQGCDKAFSTCRDRFANSVNFRGFPHMPGNYQALNYIDEETVFDGGPIVP